MDQGKWFSASLVIAGETLQPDEIGYRLGLTPTRTRLRGEPRSPNSKLVWNHSSWQLDSQLSDNREPVDHLNSLLDLLEPKSSAIKEVVGEFHVEIFCGFSSENGQGGFTLGPAMLGRLARLGIPLTLDLYPPPLPSSNSATSEANLGER